MTFTALYAAHRPYVRGVVRTLGATEPDVDDLTQEVFCVLLRRPLQDSEPRGVRRWLYQTARRVVSNHRRGRRREAPRLERAWEAVPPTCPEGEAMRGEARERLAHALAELPSEARALYRLSEAEGLPGPVVAERLGLNPNTAYARIRALRHRLAQAVLGDRPQRLSSSARILLLLALLLAALLVSQAGCTVALAPSSVVSRAEPAREVPDDRRVALRPALRGPALALAALAAGR
jgi:RNA polymerase sigma factor (sigma-70 family)